MDSGFTLAGRKELSAEKYPAYIRDMSVIDVVGHSKPEDYYDLDEHLRESGQFAVAKAVIEAIRADQASS